MNKLKTFFVVLLLASFTLIVRAHDSNAVSQQATEEASPTAESTPTVEPSPAGTSTPATIEPSPDPTTQELTAEVTIEPTGNLVQHQIPDTLGGYRVLLVLTPTDTACMRPGAKRLVLQADQPDVHSFLANSRADAILRDLRLVEAVERAAWEVTIVGPGATREGILAENGKWNAVFADGECSRLGPAALIGSTDEEFRFDPPQIRGWAMYENIDAGTYTDDNAQSVYLVAPSTIGNNQTEFSAFLNNVLSDGNWFFQNGLHFRNGVGSVVWSDTTQGLAAQNYPTSLPFVAGHTYWFVISFGYGPAWQLCAYDTSDINTYYCVIETTYQGTTLQGNNYNTSVFVENANTNSNWYQGFSNPWEAYGAEIFRNGFPQYWSGRHRHTVHGCPISYSPIYAMSLFFANGDTGRFWIHRVPLRCN